MVQGREYSSLGQDRIKGGGWIKVKVMALPKRMKMGGNHQEAVLQIQSVLVSQLLVDGSVVH